MQALIVDALWQQADILRMRSGAAVTVRPADSDDADALQAYFRGLSAHSRYSRLMGAVSEISRAELDKFTHVSFTSVGAASFPLIATVRRDDGGEIIVGEARYVLNEETGGTELALSIGDAMQRRGLGRQLMANLECRATAAGGQELFGDTLRSNEAMIALARSLGYALTPTPGEWKQVRFEKRLGISKLAYPCASLRLAVAAKASAGSTPAP